MNELGSWLVALLQNNSAIDSALDVHTLVDVAAVVVSVLGGYLAAMRAIDKRLVSLETKVAVLLDRDRRKRLADYEEEGYPNGGV